MLSRPLPGRTNLHDMWLCMQTAIVVPPGQCFNLSISSVPTTNSGTVSYTVPIMGAISVWFTDKVNIPGGTGEHFNWNPDVGTILQFAVVSISEGLCSHHDLFAPMIRLIKLHSSAACPTREAWPQWYHSMQATCLQRT